MLVFSYYNETSCWEQIKFITEDYFTEHTNITTKLKQKLFTQVIKLPSKEAWVWIDRESNQKRSAGAVIEGGVEKMS